MGAHVEIPEWVNEHTVEQAYARATRSQETRKMSVAQAGMRAARARDSKLLKALEGGAEVLRVMSERQLGTTFNVGGTRVDATEYTLWREAYRTCDEGDPAPQLQWVYGAAAELAGLVL